MDSTAKNLQFLILSGREESIALAERLLTSLDDEQDFHDAFWLLQDVRLVDRLREEERRSEEFVRGLYFGNERLYRAQERINKQKAKLLNTEK